MFTAPYDDEPLTAEDLAAIRAGDEAIRRGETIPMDEVLREFGLPDSQTPRLPSPYSNRLWNRAALRPITTKPIAASATICGHSTVMPLPFKNSPRTISMKYRTGFK